MYLNADFLLGASIVLFSINLVLVVYLLWLSFRLKKSAAINSQQTDQILSEAEHLKKRLGKWESDLDLVLGQVVARHLPDLTQLETKLDTQLQTISQDYNLVLKTSTQEFSTQFETKLASELTEAIDQVKSQLAQKLDAITSQVTEQTSGLVNQQQQKIARITSQIIVEFAKDILHKQLSQSDQHQLVLSHITKAWENSSPHSHHDQSTTTLAKPSA